MGRPKQASAAMLRKALRIACVALPCIGAQAKAASLPILGVGATTPCSSWIWARSHHPAANDLQNWVLGYFSGQEVGLSSNFLIGSNAATLFAAIDTQCQLEPVLTNLYKGGHLHIFMWLGIIILAAVAALTFIDRKYNDEFPKNWTEGLIESLYQVLSVVTTGKSSHKLLFGIYGRLVSSFWLLCGVAVVAYITSSITAVMTVASLNDQIHSADDLHGNAVGAIEGTVGEGWCLDAGLQTQSFPDLPAAVHALLRRQIVGIVGDAATLEYYDNSHPELPITEVGAIFQPSTDGFAMPVGSKMGRAISVQIVASMEDGTLTKMTAKYFGVEP